MLFSTKYLHFFIAALLLTKFLLSTFPLYFCFLCFVINLCVVLGVSACCCVLFYFPCLSACVIALIVPTCVLSAPFCFPAVSSPRCALRPWNRCSTCCGDLQMDMFDINGFLSFQRFFPPLCFRKLIKVFCSFLSRGTKDVLQLGHLSNHGYYC